jgi:hypothetical protein
MSLPPDPDSITISPIHQTNSYLAKYYDGSFGLFLRDITDVIPKRNYKHMEINLKNTQQIIIPGKGHSSLQNCLILRADNEIKTPLLSLILDFLHEQEPSGQFSASDLICILDDVEELIRKSNSPPSLEEVIGVWGELYVLRMFLNNTQNHLKQFQILKGWEGEIREKIDFRFIFCKQALEIKSTVSDKRIHHLHGLEQVTIPYGFDSGILVSLRLELGNGLTNLFLIDSIRKSFIGNDIEKQKCLELLEKRIILRGYACDDNNFSIALSPDGIKFFQFSTVPKPGQAEGVFSIEWESDLTKSLALNSFEIDELINKITK